MGRDPIGACCTHGPSQSCPPTRASPRATTRGGHPHDEPHAHAADARKVIVGIDTHKHVHVAVAIDTWGIRLGDQAFVADSGGYEALVMWAETHGRIEAFGIEGTGSYGAGLARAVRRAGHRVVEVNRGDRRTRRAAGKSDTIDAEVAARSVLAGQSTAIPKTADGAVEMRRQLKITRDTALEAGERLAELARSLGAARVEQIVREIEDAWAADVGPEAWLPFADAIVVDSYEGRYPGLESPFDRYRAPYVGASDQPCARWDD